MMKVITAILLASSAMSTTFANADTGWKYGIGTGVFGLNIDGDLGFGTALGPAKFDVDMSSSDLQEFLETAYGFGGYASNGQWTILYKYAFLELQDDEKGNLPTGTPVSGDITFTAKGGELAAVYNIMNSGDQQLGALFGVRYTDHDINARVAVGASTAKRSLGEDWTDAIVGLTYAMSLTKTLMWNNRIDVGYGGSDGTYHFNTGVTWKFADSWSTNVYVDYLKHDFEENDRGDADWYLYDAAEFGAGIGILFHF